MNHLTEILYLEHIKNVFSCGKELPDNYLHRQANQDIKRKLSACVVIKDQETNLLKRYYTLANNSIPQETIPKQFKKNYQNHIFRYQLPCLEVLPLTIVSKVKELGNYC